MRVRVPKKKLYIGIAIVVLIFIIAVLAPNFIVRARDAGRFDRVEHVVIDTVMPE